MVTEHPDERSRRPWSFLKDMVIRNYIPVKASTHSRIFFFGLPKEKELDRPGVLALLVRYCKAGADQSLMQAELICSISPGEKTSKGGEWQHA